MTESREERIGRMKRTFGKLQKGDLFHCGGGVQYIMVEKGSNIYQTCRIIVLNKTNRLAIAEGKRPLVSAVKFKGVRMLEIISTI